MIAKSQELKNKTPIKDIDENNLETQVLILVKSPLQDLSASLLYAFRILPEV